MYQRTFPDTLTRLEAFKRIFVLRPKIDIFPMGKSMVLAKNEQILKSEFLTF